MNTIIIPVFNNSKFTKNILKQIKDFEGEIIIANDGSTDDTIDVVNEYNATLVNMGYNSGFAKAVNSGFRESSGDKVMFLNNDVVLKGTLEDLNYTFSLIKPDTLHGPTGGYVDLKTMDFMYHTDSISKKINYMSGWCVFGFKSTFDKFMEDGIGPFTEEFVTYFEDTYMGLRSQQVGVKFKITKTPFAHIGMGTSSKLNLEKIYVEAKKKFKQRISNNFSKQDIVNLGKRYGFE